MARPTGHETRSVVGDLATPAPARIGASLRTLRSDATACQACPLWRRATQTVFGEGPEHAALMLVGEQPGDQVRRPAGRLLQAALDEIGVARNKVYLTNAVKHFKWTPSPGRGKRRIHQKPSTVEVNACRPWLFAEIAALKPRVIICLGATAAQALLGPKFRVTQQRGELVLAPLPGSGSPLRIVATVHPSSILRAPDEETRRRDLRHFVRDLRAATSHVAPRH